MSKYLYASIVELMLIFSWMNDWKLSMFALPSRLSSVGFIVFHRKGALKSVSRQNPSISMSEAGWQILISTQTKHRPRPGAEPACLASLLHMEQTLSFLDTWYILLFKTRDVKTQKTFCDALLAHLSTSKIQRPIKNCLDNIDLWDCHFSAEMNVKTRVDSPVCCYAASP